MTTRITYYSYKNLLFVLLVISGSVKAQPDYDFRNPVRISGTLNQPGSKYRFSNVRAGTDAIVTFVLQTGGVTLQALDDGTSGYVEALQPVLRVPAVSDGYIELLIEFVNAGTLVPKVIPEVSITCIDVDGRVNDLGDTNKLFEYEVISLNPAGSYFDYQMVSGEVTITSAGNWVTGKNATGVSYPLVDTTAKSVMFTTVNSNISSLTMRFGTDSKRLGVEVRLMSAYFKKFVYSSSFLSKVPLLSFNGVEKGDQITLNWGLSANHDLRSVIIERAYIPSKFEKIGEIRPGTGVERSSNKFFRYDDLLTTVSTYYRLRMENFDGAVIYSNILVFRPKASDHKSFKVYPNLIQSFTTVAYKSEKAGDAIFKLIDYSGKIVFQQKLPVVNGENIFSINNLSGLNHGNYVAVLNTVNGVHYRKLIKE